MSTVYLLSVEGIDADQIEGICGERLNHITAMQKAEDRKRSIGASILLKKYLKTQGRALKDVKTTVEGKPYVEGLYFSIAHSGKFAALAVSKQEIGMDMEVIRPYPHKVAAQKFNPMEQAMVLESDDPDEMFMRIWTAKEAFLKWKGTGIRTSLKDVDTCNLAIKTKTVGDMVISVCTAEVEEMKKVIVQEDFTEH